ncbi:MAG: UDP-N-acetylmuramate dehydrogenase [Clostridia bacterium]|nr:UDP-N-acetylmuramate dehydrogenase [Clostridia bacterium]
MDEPMSNHTSFKIGGTADIFVKADSVEILKSLLEFAKSNDIDVTIIGNGSNLLVKDNGIRGIVIKLDFKDIKIEKLDDKRAKVIAEAGVTLGMLAQRLVKENISGFEFAAAIPGSIGGAVRMNAGAYGGEFKDIVVKTKCMDEDGNIKVLTNEEQKFSYRHSIFAEEKLIILETELLLNIEDNSDEIRRRMAEYLESRKAKQPLNYPSAGSTFKRGADFITAKLIDDCGLKGFSIGGAQVSEVHAGFVVNTGNATAEDVLNLVNHVKEKVFEKFGKEIELEIEVLGE